MYLARETVKILQSNFINTANFFLSIGFLQIIGRRASTVAIPKKVTSTQKSKHV